MARVVYQGEAYTVKLLLPDMGSFTYTPKDLWNLNDIVYAFMPEPNKPAYIMPIKAVSSYSSTTTNVIDKDTSFNTPPIYLIQLAIWKSDSSKKIYVSIVAFGVDESGYGHNVIPKPNEEDAELLLYIGRIVGTSGSLAGGYTPVVCFDTDFNFADCERAGLINATFGNGLKIHAPSNIAPIVAILIGAAIVGGTIVGTTWGLGYLEHAKAEEVKAMQQTERERLRTENIKAIQNIIDTIINNVEDDGDATKIIESVFGSNGYLSEYLNKPPSDNEDENVNNSNDWWKGVGEFMKQLLPFAIPIIGIIILVFKWRVILDFFSSLFERFRRR